MKPLLFAVMGLALATGATAQSSPRLRASDIDTIALRQKAVRVAYGTDSLQFGDLRLPEGRGPFPVAVVIHGGCYLTRYATLRNTAAIADALAGAGIATWNIEYRRYDSPGGGFPGTFNDAVEAVNYLQTLRRLHPIDVSRVVIVGHSAGGQLALWLSAPVSSQLATSPRVTALQLRVQGAVALAPITDMREFQTRQLRSCGNPAIESVLGGMPDAVPDRLRLLSPIERLPVGVPVVLIAGDQDGIAPRSALDAFAAAARARGDSVQTVITPGESHFDVLAPFRSGGKEAIAAVKRLLGVPN